MVYQLIDNSQQPHIKNLDMPDPAQISRKLIQVQSATGLLPDHQKRRVRCLVHSQASKVPAPVSAHLAGPVLVGPVLVGLDLAGPVLVGPDWAQEGPPGSASESSAPSPHRCCSTARRVPRRSCNASPNATEDEILLPEPVVERVLERLAHKGVVTTEDGVATLTDFGRKVLAKRGITSQTAQALRAKVFPKLVNVLKLRSGLAEIAGLARVIAITGTDEQKEKLAEAGATLLATVNDVKRSLQSAVA
ncbi:Uncharacterised protein [Mycobacteroides abscessus subsp. abscessus]|nr:Uncharacterised protein [Mycobacteroides abscessus subsp. abscessus]SKH00892.1 Uncharacterised protein [Mycobacteroides abscessus subsp. abscessus]SKH32635.1 Uncharacterised protein [Mycobacteroides abscessus subsp. abscessus]SKH62165.1 Uncharacterised protein [Mycobacteroides abscessus subsp. abscessus]SKH72758.1 Uncharacterised protein [Mycobacteroides abscessus subsp. abscessus]